MADTKETSIANRGRPATAYDVARLAGVSQSAVSRTFTVGASVSEGTRLKVLEAAQKLKYRPSHMASSLKTRRSYIVGLAVTHLDNQFYPPIIEKLSEALRQAGYRILLFVTHGDINFDPALDELLRYRVDALILASTSLSSALAQDCRDAGVPVVMVNNVDPESAIASVAGDNYKGGETIAAFLHAGGHQRYGYISGVESSSTSREREAGFNSFFASQGLPPPVRAISNYRPESGMTAARHLLASPTPPDALFCVNDQMAIAAMEVARHEFGLEVGRDISIVGFDNTAMSAWPSFSLTTYSQPADQLVASTMTLLEAVMERTDAPIEHVIVPGQLIVRTSARLPNGFSPA
ncbi:MAG: LacI family DNA-binding transcriptional regulator [Asticcacaulis sp.]|uniref:LacI family DNA-binding transcriptional regulator n=1 Tax=Asticcacaulis sp. TaxID=1872648 RepID=UPI0039E6F74F